EYTLVLDDSELDFAQHRAIWPGRLHIGDEALRIVDVDVACCGELFELLGGRRWWRFGLWGLAASRTCRFGRWLVRWWRHLYFHILPRPLYFHGIHAALQIGKARDIGEVLPLQRIDLIEGKEAIGRFGPHSIGPHHRTQHAVHFVQLADELTPGF